MAALEVKRREIARLLGVSIVTIDDWVSRGMPVASKGSRGVASLYDVAACFRWKLDYELAEATARSTQDLSLADAERRQVIADATLKEIKVAEALRQVVRVEDVSRLWEGRTVASRETFLGFAARLAPILVGQTDQSEIEAILEREIGKALDELAAWEPDDPSDLEDDGDEGHADPADDG